ncbi:MAG: DMT family transporter [Candidatus Marinamargulisbacteria bacterium]
MFKRVIFEVYLSIFLLSFTGLFAKIIGWNPINIIFWRSIIAGISIFLFLRFTNRSIFVKSKQDAMCMVILGVVMILHWVSYYWSIQLSTVSIGMISLYSYPVITSLLEPLITKEKFVFSNILTAIFVLFGIFIMSPEITLSNKMFFGSLVGIGSAILMSLRNILSRPFVKKYTGERLMMYQMIGVIFLTPFLGIFYEPWRIQHTVNVLILGVICTAVAHTLWIRSLNHFKATTMGTMSCLAPVLGSLLSILILGEKLTINIIIGGGIILSAAIYETKKQMAF